MKKNKKNKTVKIITYGCAMNKADSELIAGVLADEGFSVSDDGEVIVIVNTCTVKTPTERKIIKRLKELDEEKKKVIVTGCMPVAQPEIPEMFSGRVRSSGISAIRRALDCASSVVPLLQVDRLDASARNRRDYCGSRPQGIRHPD